MTKPMLATLYKKDPFDDPDWIFEKKFDGIRCLACFDGKKCMLFSRNENEITNQYPEIAKKLKNLSKKPFIIDGELVVLSGKLGSFEKMQKRSHVENPSKELIKKYPVEYFVFDIIKFDGKSLKKNPLTKRKEILKKLSFSQPIHYTKHESQKGKSFVKKMKRQQYEGAIAKHSSSHYVSTRSKKWLKLKCEMQQEFVVGGFTDPKKSRKGFGALLVGFYEGKEFVYCGKIGTGFDDKTLKDFEKKLNAIKRKTSPFSKKSPKETASTHWVRPKYIIEVHFTEWTDDDMLRHASFIGERTDKNPKNVTRN